MKRNKAEEDETPNEEAAHDTAMYIATLEDWVLYLQDQAKHEFAVRCVTCGRLCDSEVTPHSQCEICEETVFQCFGCGNSERKDERLYVCTACNKEYCTSCGGKEGDKCDRCSPL